MTKASDDYFDEDGNSLRKAFLKAPVEFSRISNRYNLKRFHPILNRTKAHYGTDYAAPTGTPILAVGDGVVTNPATRKGTANMSRSATTPPTKPSTSTCPTRRHCG